MESPIPKLIPPIAISAQFQTKNTIVATATATNTQLLEADPRRVWVSFTVVQLGVFSCLVYPEPQLQFTAAVGDINTPLEVKFHDCPSLVTGAWFCLTPIGTEILISECLYVGG